MFAPTINENEHFICVTFLIYVTALLPLDWAVTSAKHVTQYKRIYINLCKKKYTVCAIQYTVDLINNNINRDVQEECANRLYLVYTHSSNTDDENSEG